MSLYMISEGVYLPRFPHNAASREGVKIHHALQFHCLYIYRIVGNFIWVQIGYPCLYLVTKHCLEAASLDYYSG